MRISADPRYAQALGALLRGAPFSTRVRGQCMAPVIGDDCLVEVDPDARLRCGDVLVWRDDAGQLVCHRYLGRFLGRRGLGRVSWADNEGKPDVLVPGHCMLGKVTRVDGRALHIDRGTRNRSRLRYLRYCAGRIRGLIR